MSTLSKATRVFRRSLATLLTLMITTPAALAQSAPSLSAVGEEHRLSQGFEDFYDTAFILKDARTGQPRVTSFAETSDGRYLITLTGVCRFRAGEELPARTPYRQVRADFSPYEADLREDGAGARTAADIDRLLTALRRYLDHRGLAIDWGDAESAPSDALINSLAMALPFDPMEKQALLEAETIFERKATLTALLEIDAAGSDDDEPTSIQ